MAQEEFDKITQVLCNTIKDLQKENEELKKLCDKYEEEHNTTFKEWQKDIQANKEAIEYINKFWKEKSYYESVENCLKFATMNEFEKEDLLNILEGKNEYNK